MKNNYKKFISISTISIIFCFIFVNIVFAQSKITSLLSATSTRAGFSEATDTSLSEYIGSIIQYLLSFLGVIFIVLTIYGGFLWMTASGDNDQITKAKDVIKSSVVGLVIVVAAYTLTYYLLTNILISAGL